jgi:hypothetical protein
MRHQADQKSRRWVHTQKRKRRFDPRIVWSWKLFLMEFQDQTKRGSIQSKSNVFYHRRIIVRDGLTDIVTISGQQSTLIIQAWIPASISILRMKYFKCLNQLHSISFERDSRLTRIESLAFYPRIFVQL